MVLAWFLHARPTPVVTHALQRPQVVEELMSITDGQVVLRQHRDKGGWARPRKRIMITWHMSRQPGWRLPMGL